MAAGMLSFIALGTAEVQYYNDPDWKERKKSEERKQDPTKS